MTEPASFSAAKIASMSLCKRITRVLTAVLPPPHRYGGIVARRAAITIQRAYRRYAMYKKFRSITATAKAQEKRLSRRFTVDVPEWGDAPTNQQFHDACNELDQMQRNISATGESVAPTGGSSYLHMR